jgi:hypothetical protein
MNYYACVSKATAGLGNQASVFLYRRFSWFIANEWILPFDVNNRYLWMCTGTQNGADRLHHRLDRSGKYIGRFGLPGQHGRCCD